MLSISEFNREIYIELEKEQADEYLKMVDKNGLVPGPMLCVVCKKEGICQRFQTPEITSLCGGYLIKSFYWDCVYCEKDFKYKKISKR